MILIRTIHENSESEDLFIPGAILSFGMSGSVSVNAKALDFDPYDPSQEIAYPADHKKIAFPKYHLSIHLHDIFGVKAKAIIESLRSNHFRRHLNGRSGSNLSFDSTFLFEPIAVFICHAEADEDELFPSSFVTEFLTAGYIETFSYDTAHGASGDDGGVLSIVIADCRLIDNYADYVKWSKIKDGVHKTKNSQKGKNGNNISILE